MAIRHITEAKKSMRDRVDRLARADFDRINRAIGLRLLIRSDRTPIGNCAKPASAAKVETRPMARSDIPCWRRYSGK
jgi:hypothetical protein